MTAYILIPLVALALLVGVFARSLGERHRVEPPRIVLREPVTRGVVLRDLAAVEDFQLYADEELHTLQQERDLDPG